VVLAAIAELADFHRTGPAHRFGRVLSERKVSEARVLRLLRAHDEVLLDTVRDVVHQLASSGARVDLSDLATLVTSDGTAWQTEVRRSIALDYYRTHGA
jgi:CRISPR type I-E-associated protein CasB/Cse2